MRTECNHRIPHRSGHKTGPGRLLVLYSPAVRVLPLRDDFRKIVGLPKLCNPISSSIILTLNLLPQLRWDCRRIVNCAGIETIAILIRATVANTKLSTVNLKGMSNYIVMLSNYTLCWTIVPMSFRGVEWLFPMSVMLDDHRIGWIVLSLPVFCQCLTHSKYGVVNQNNLLNQKDCECTLVLASRSVLNRR